jgi:uncharacterized radical SAM superfamily protein
MRTITLYRPGKGFPSVSVTGERCEMMCAHCQGRFLKGMVPAMDPDTLVELALNVHSSGGSGLLISGGCSRQGKVPLGPFLPTIRRIREITPLLINIHPGLVSKEEATDIAAASDGISFDLVLDERAIRERMHLDRTPDDYLGSLRFLCQAAPGRVAPHVLLGIGREENDTQAVRRACQEDISCLVLLSLIGEKVPDWEGRLLRAVEIGAHAGRDVLLGCMRPRGRPDLEMSALESGASGIAWPSAETVKRINEKGWAVAKKGYCCGLHR